MAEPPKETWIQWVALTATILAGCAAISSLKASSYSTRVQIHTTKEANHWAYYQSKSIKEQETLKRHNAAFVLAVTLLQIAIMMSALASLIKRKIK